RAAAYGDARAAACGDARAAVYGDARAAACGCPRTATAGHTGGAFEASDGTAVYAVAEGRGARARCGARGFRGSGEIWGESVFDLRLEAADNPSGQGRGLQQRPQPDPFPAAEQKNRSTW